MASLGVEDEVDYDETWESKCVKPPNIDNRPPHVEIRGGIPGIPKQAEGTQVP
jgi:hypothetical protein